MNGNWYQAIIQVGLNLILNSYFDTDYFDCLIDYICFVRNFVIFFGLVIVLGNSDYKVIVAQSNFSYLEVVFLNYYYYECFHWVNFDLFSCIDKMIYLVLYIFVVCFNYLVVFVCIRQCCVRIFGVLNAPFFE